MCVQTRVHAARAHAAQEEENRERLKKLEHMHVLIAEARERLRRLTSQHTAESKCLGAVRRGLKSLLETLGEEETDPLRDGSLMSYFGVCVCVCVCVCVRERERERERLRALTDSNLLAGIIALLSVLLLWLFCVLRSVR